MKAGKLRHRVTLQRSILQSDGIGGGTVTWTDVASLWANVMLTGAGNTSNVETITADQFRSVQTYVIQMRYQTGITTAMRLLYQGRVLEILSITNIDEQKKNCSCTVGKEDNMAVKVRMRQIDITEPVTRYRYGGTTIIKTTEGMLFSPSPL